MKKILPSVWTLSSHPSGSGPRSSWCRLTTIHSWSDYKRENSSAVEPDPHHFRTLDPDPDPHQGDKPDLDQHQLKIGIRIRIERIVGPGSESASNKNQDSDPHLSDKSDPDLHPDPQLWKTGSLTE
jgi:hypothetical protein